jgi:hypothetical protein
MTRLRLFSIGLGTTALALSVAGAAFGLSRAIYLDQGTPVSLLTVEHDSRESALIALGELAFKSDFLLEASPLRTLGANMTCDTCHPDGGARDVVFFEGLSDKPGNLDVTNRAISLLEDGVFNPLNVPSVRGSKHTAPFGRDGRFDSVEDFTLFAIANEFAGGTPSDLVIESLVVFQETLPFPENPLVDASGRLTEAAPDTAKRGETIFNRPFATDPDMSCATCHVPSDYFVDHLTHDVGSGRGGRLGKKFETPTLLETTFTPPYFHDGRHDTLAEVVDYFDDYFTLGLSDAERTDLTAYLEAVGGGTLPEPASTAAVFPSTALTLLEVSLEDDDWLLTRMLVSQLSTELDNWRGAPDAPADAALDQWIKLMRRIEAQTKGQDFDGARATLIDLETAIGATAGG